MEIGGWALMKSGRLQKAGPTKTRGVEFVGWKLVGAAYVEERSPAALGIKKPHLQKPTAWSLLSGNWEDVLTSKSGRLQKAAPTKTRGVEFG